MPELEELSLYRTKVSNAGLAKLAALKRLRALDLRYSRATGAGVRELLAVVPDWMTPVDIYIYLLRHKSGSFEMFQKVFHNEVELIVTRKLCFFN
jgi:hypothetical protein